MPTTTEPTRQSMQEEIDIGRMISQSTADVSVADLSRRGFKKVKVLNHQTIRKLVTEAVQRVLQVRQEAISRSERERVIEQSRRELDRLLKEKVQQERERARETERQLEEKQHQVEHLTREVVQLRGDLEAKIAYASNMEGECERLKAELSHTGAETQRLQEELKRATEDLAYYRRAYEEAQAPQEKQGSGVDQLAGLFRELIQEMRSSAAASEQKTSEELKASMELLADRIAEGIRQAGGSAGGAAPGLGDTAEELMAAFLKLQDTPQVETNIGRVEAKKAQAKKGVAGSLEKLRAMQKGGGSDSGS